MYVLRRKISILFTLVCLITSTNFVHAEAYWSRTAEVRDGTPYQWQLNIYGLIKI